MLSAFIGKGERPTLVHMVLASALAFLPVVIVSGILLYAYAQSERAGVVQRVEAQLQALLSTVESEVAAQIAITKVIGKSPSVTGGRLDELAGWWQSLHEDYPANILVTRPNGHVLNGNIPLPHAPSPYRLELNARALREGRVVLSGVFQANHREDPIVSTAYATTCGYEPCTLSVGLPASYYLKALKRDPIPPGWVMTLVDGDDNIIARSLNHEQRVGTKITPRLTEQLDGMGRPNTGMIEGRTLEGQATISTFERVDGTDWYVVVGAPRDLLREPLRRSIYVLLVEILVIILAGFSASYLISTRIVKSLRLLGQQSSDIKQHKLHLTTLTTPLTEVNDVSATLVDSAEQMKAKEAAVQESLARVRLLTRETLHRAKNQLTIVQVMARQTANVATDLADFQAKFDMRLSGLSQTQSLLVNSDWKGVTIRSLVRAQLAHYTDLIGTRIQLNGPELTVMPEPAQNLGLALHELSSNATKYGALAAPYGTITVTWGIVGGHFVIEWVERGGPPITADPTRKGFGTLVTTKLVAQAFDGKVTTHWEPEGLRWRLVGSTDYFEKFDQRISA